MDGAKQYHEKQCIAYYLEFPAPDDWHFDTRSVMREVNAKLGRVASVKRFLMQARTFRRAPSTIAGMCDEGQADKAGRRAGSRSALAHQHFPRARPDLSHPKQAIPR